MIKEKYNLAHGEGFMETILMTSRPDASYQSDTGYILRREYGKTPNGNLMNGRWVLRNNKGNVLGFNQYINDLAERFSLEFVI